MNLEFGMEQGTKMHYNISYYLTNSMFSHEQCCLLWLNAETTFHLVQSSLGQNGLQHIAPSTLLKAGSS